MLDDSLRRLGYPKSYFNAEARLDVPEGWKMPENVLSRVTGDVPLCDTVRYPTDYVHPDFYKGILISNPNMMFVCPYSSYTPLQALDAYAWMLAGYATGWLEMPTQEEMRKRNESEALMLLGIPYFRYYMDANYCSTVNNLEDFWPDDGEHPDEWDEVEEEEWHLSIKRLAQIMQEGQYPFDLGNYEELNENGKAFIKFGDLSYYHRANLGPSDWKTFRDADDADKFYSLFTGTKAVPLQQRWIDTEASGSGDEKENTARI